MKSKLIFSNNGIGFDHSELKCRGRDERGVGLLLRYWWDIQYLSDEDVWNNCNVMVHISITQGNYPTSRDGYALTPLVSVHCTKLQNLTQLPNIHHMNLQLTNAQMEQTSESVFGSL